MKQPPPPLLSQVFGVVNRKKSNMVVDKKSLGKSAATEGIPIKCRK